MSLIQDGPINHKPNDHEITNKPQEAPESVEVNEQSFMELITQTSMQMPVVFVFYSSGSPASQKVKGQIEKIIKSTKVFVQLAALNIDKAPALSSQLQIQSVPTVMAFFQGQPLDGFAGPQEDDFIRQFLGKITGQDLQDPKEAAAAALEAGQKALDDGHYDDVITIAGQILQHYPDLGSAIALLLKAYGQKQDMNAVTAIKDQLSEELQKDVDISSALKFIELSQNKVEDHIVEQLKEAYKADKTDLDASYNLVEALIGNSENQEAMALLLDIIRQDRSFKENIAQKKLLELFEALGVSDPLVVQGRKKLSNLLF